MTGKTHASFGFLSGLALATIYGSAIPIGDMSFSTYGVIGATFFGALIPDIDHHNSSITNQMGVVGKVVSKASKHRYFWHSWVPLSALAYLTFYVDSLSGDILNMMRIAALVLCGIQATLITLKYVGILSGKVKLAQQGMFIISLAVLFGTLFSGTGINTVLASVSLGLLVGYISHLVADSMNPDGIHFLWPSKAVIRFPFISITTGSIGEKIFFLLTILGNGYCLYRIISGGLI